MTEKHRTSNQTSIKTRITKVGNSMYLLMPDEVMNALNLEEKSEVEVMVERAEDYGLYMSAWNPEQQKKQDNLDRIQE